MIKKSKKKETPNPSPAVELCASGLSERKVQSSPVSQQPAGRWLSPSSTGPIPPAAFPPPVFHRKRRIYADYRELLALEAQGRKLNTAGSAAERLLLAQVNGGSHERVLKSADADGNGSVLAAPLDQPGDFSPSNVAPPERQAILVVDQRMNMFFGTQRNLKSVVAVNAAAILAWQVFARQKNIGAVVFNDRDTVQFSPGCSRLHTLLILQNILNQNHGLLPDAGIRSNPGMLNEALRCLSVRTVVNSLIYLITDASGCDAETARLMTDISRQNELVVILVYDPQQTGLCATVCSEDRALAETLGSPAFGKNQRIGDQLRLAMRRLFPEGSPLIPLDTRHDIARQLRRAFAEPIFPCLVWCAGSAVPPAKART